MSQFFNDHEIQSLGSSLINCGPEKIWRKKNYEFIKKMLFSFSKYKPPGGLYLEGRFNGGFFALPVWGAYIWRGLYMEGLIRRILRYFQPFLRKMFGQKIVSKMTYAFWSLFLTRQILTFWRRASQSTGWNSLTFFLKISLIKEVSLFNRRRKPACAPFLPNRARVSARCTQTGHKYAFETSPSTRDKKSDNDEWHEYIYISW